MVSCILFADMIEEMRRIEIKIKRDIKNNLQV